MLALIEQGYHCEWRGDACVYRPAKQWVRATPCCEPCVDECRAAYAKEPEDITQPSKHGRRYNFPPKLDP